MAHARWMVFAVAVAFAHGEAYSPGVESGPEVPQVQALAAAAPAVPMAGADDPVGHRFRRIVEQASRAHGVDGALVHAVIFAESSYDPKAVSPAGASGLMQLMPGTARHYGVEDLFDPEQNVHGGVRHLKGLLDRFDGDLELALAAYNAGAGAVIRAGNRVPPYPETARYVPRVLGHYHRLRGGHND